MASPLPAFRVGVGGIVHETNTYAAETFGPTGLDAFPQVAGEDIVRVHRGTRTCIGGMIDAAADLGAELVPLWWSMAQPSGTIAADAYRALRASLLEAIAAAGPLDALALDLHGGGVAEGAEDLEADLGRAVRTLIGPDLPIVVTLDLHGNVSDAMAEVFDVMIGYHLYPHTDQWERGDEAVRLLPRLLDGSLRPRTYIDHLPILLPTSTTDPGHPAAAMNELCRQLEAQPGVVDCTVFHGFPFTDVPEVGVHVVATTDADPDLARRTAAVVGAWIWETKDQFRTEHPTPDQAVRVALQLEGQPIVINETNDNPGGGAPGDGTQLLAALIDQGARNAVFGFLCDPESAEACHRAGVGSTVHLRLGGRHDDLHGAPIETDAYVKVLTDGRFTLRAVAAGSRLSLGRCARVVLGDRHGGIEVIVTERRAQTLDDAIFRLHGIDVAGYKIVALKSSNHFRAGFRDLAAAIVTSDAPGLTTTRVEVFDHPRSPRALWPQDPGAGYAPPDVSDPGRLAADFAVVGAGMAGVSVGAALAAAGAGVVVLEAEDRPGHHATGRSVALFSENYGNETVRRLTVASRPFLGDPPPGFTPVPLLRPRGSLTIGRSDQLDRLVQLRTGGTELVADLEQVDCDGARQLCPALSEGYVAGGVWEPRAADIDVDALLSGYQRRLGQGGGTLVTGTPVRAAHRRDGRWVLEGVAVTVEARVVVNAAGAWADDVGALFGARPLGLVPLRRTAFLFDLPGQERTRDWPLVVDVDETFYFKPEGGRLVGSPADETPSRPVDARPEEIDVALALDRIGTAVGVELRHAHRPWAGLRTFAPDRTPVAGPDPDVHDLIWLVGQGGYGIQTAPALADATATLLLAGDLSPALTAVGLRSADLAPARFRPAGAPEGRP